jgi:hypothetical protein
MSVIYNKFQQQVSEWNTNKRGVIRSVYHIIRNFRLTLTLFYYIFVSAK